MRHAGEWLCAHAPQAGVYLWVMAANTPATDRSTLERQLVQSLESFLLNHEQDRWISFTG